MANELTTQKAAESKLANAAAKLTDWYMSDVANLNAAVGVPLTDESKRCATNVLLKLCGEIGAEAVSKMPRDQLLQVLQFVTVNGLDAFGGQVFLDKRKDRNGNYVSVTATPMGSAYEIMTARFGVNVKTVHPARIVHEGDEFELPQFDGLKMTNVKHKLTLKGLDSKAIAVYYIIEKKDGTLDFAIATREGVARNLMAQILNATLRADVNRGELMAKMEGKSLDELLADKDLAPFISPAYRSPASRESMIVTKMKKNALLHYTRDLGVANSDAFEKVNAKAFDDDSDMVVASVAEDDGKPEPKAIAIQDFEVEEAPVREAEPAKPAKPTPKEEPKEEPKPEPREEPKPEPKTVQASVFDVDDL